MGKIRASKRHVALLAACCVVVALALAGCGGSGGQASQAQQPSGQSLQVEASSQASADELYTRMDLDQLEQVLQGTPGFDDERFVYIGRTDCTPCEEFDVAMAQVLERNEQVAPRYVYYTNDDRTGPQADRMYALLDKVPVNEVPCVLVMKGGKVLYKWSSPVMWIAEMEKYLASGELPSGTASGSSGYVQDQLEYAKLDRIDVQGDTVQVVFKECQCEGYTLYVERTNHPGVTVEEKDGVLTVREKPAGETVVTGSEDVGGSNAAETAALMMPSCTVTLSMPSKLTLGKANVSLEEGSLQVVGGAMGTLDATFDTSSVVIEEASIGTCTLEGNDGTVDVSMASGLKNAAWDVQLENGSIRVVDTPKGQDPTLDLRTANGSITFHGQPSGTSYTRDGSTSKIAARLGTGDITVEAEE